jgi:beta-galactosidase
MILKHHATIFAVVAGLICVTFSFLWRGADAHAQAATEAGGRTIADFNSEWRFSKGDPAGAEKTDFDDQSWQPVRLPHDWAIAGPFNPEENGYAAKLPWRGVGWYRKTFALDEAQRGKRVYLDFDGVMAFPKVYVNGELAGEWDYGYTPFQIDITKHVKFGEPNVVAVRCDTTKHGTRWYPGAGIYRGVKLTVCNPIHIAHWGTFLTTPEVNDERALVKVQTVIENHGDGERQIGVEFRFRDADGKNIGSTVDAATIPAGGSKVLSTEFTVTRPQRWDVDHPYLYSLETAVVLGGELDKNSVSPANDIDRDTTTFGVREFKFTADDGFHLNGRRVQLRGVCLHHDHGPLGGAFYRRAMERQLEIMREMGVNAIRTSHNPPAADLVDLCDRMGFVVWDECFDKWDDKADRVEGKPSLEEHGRRHLRNLVMRDRNHPSVVVWSIANEIGAVGGRDGLTKDRVAMMRDIVREYDDTRPVGLAHHIPETARGDVFDPIDVGGWNYDRRYSIFRERYPDKPILYTESASALSTRGFYELPLPGSRTDFSDKLQVDSYDLNSARWSDIADVEFALMERDKFVGGDFVWTGFDYLGEPTPFDRQATSSYFGIVDLCGIPKDRYYLYRSYWRPETTTVHILPHWNWPDRIGKNVPVFVYTNGDSAELFLNGKSLGRRTKETEIPPRINIAEGKPATASSERAGGRRPTTAAKANDGAAGTRWYADSDKPGEWWQVDLGDVQPIADVVTLFDGQPGNYQYRVDISDDGEKWRTAVSHDKQLEGWGDRLTHSLNDKARYVRIEFTELRNGARANLREVAVYPVSYYAVIDKYRLRWMDVPYEPGELKAVAYKNGERIGESVMRTAGEPAAIRVTPDRTSLAASGDDLCYVLVEAVDADGNLCPLADNMIRFRVDGPAEIAGVGNGNPISLEPNQADHRQLFYGKAMLIVRTEEGQGGDIKIAAESDGLTPAEVEVHSK